MDFYGKEMGILSLSLSLFFLSFFVTRHGFWNNYSGLVQDDL